tara:strand:- start:87 stop:950 length:864 start_codon:yes stop_codon:yes gene_type:complete
MFIIGGNQAVCPRGFICVNNYNLLLILVAVIICIYVFNKQIYLSVYNKMLESKLEEEKKQKSISPKDFGTTKPPNFTIEMDKFDGYNYDTQQSGAMLNQPFNNPTRGMPNVAEQEQIVDIDRLMLNDRLYPPMSRNHYNDPNGMMRVKAQNIPQQQMGIPINIETRGSGGDFQQVGILSKQTIDEDGKTPGNNTDANILPLYGKPIYRGASKWLYYTETDKYNPVKIPITVSGRDCTDDQGCEELYDGSEVVIPSYNGVFKVKIYKFNKPRYIPLENPKEILPLPFT